MELWNNTDIATEPLSSLSNCTVDTSYRFTFYQVSYSVIFVLGLASNGLALRRLWLSPYAFTSTAVYMANLSAADLFFVVSLPLRIYYYHLKSRALHTEPSWTPGGAFCQVTFTLKYISLYGGIFFLVCIAMDRYFAVVHPLVSAPRRRRRRTALLVAGGLWCVVLALSVGLPLLHAAAAARQHRPCLMDPSSRHQRGLILAALGLVLGAFVLPAAALVFSYCSVLRALRQPRHRQRLSRRRTLTVIYWVLAVFLLCFTPYHVNLLGYTLTHVGLLRSCGLAKVTKVLHPVVLSLASSNCCLNPLIYYFSSSLAHREPASGGAVEANESFAASRQ